MILKISAVSSYPSDTVAANLSAGTTKREIKRISGINKSTFMENNMNIIYGPTNAARYCNEMLNFPTISDIADEVKKNREQKIYT